MSHRTWRLARFASAFVAVLSCFALSHVAVAQIGDLKTVAEKSEYRATARYDDVMAFCKALDEASELVTLTEFGKTQEGRGLPLLILSKQPLTGERPWEQAKLPAILCVGNIHAGEVCGKEALLMLARDMVSPKEKSPALLEHFVLLIAPIYNADGNEKVSKDNRPGQVGPEDGMGQRANGMGLDLNRDYTKLEAPESQAMVGLLRHWDPKVVIDTHTTNGSHHRYVLTFDGPRHPATDPELADFVRQELLPGVKRRVAEADGYDTFFYGNFEPNHERRTTYPALPRYGAHYVGLRNRIAILSEAYAYAPYKERVLATKSFVSQCLNAVQERREPIAKLLAAADGRARQGTGEVALRYHIGPHEKKITVKGLVEEEKDGKRVATEATRDYEVEDWSKSVADLSVPLPTAYLFSAELKNCVENLQRHGIRIEQLREDIELDVEASRIGKVTQAEATFEGHRLATLEVEREPRRRPFAAGTIVVRTAQPLSRLAALLLEPESEDGFAAWNFYGEHLKTGGEYPVYRLAAGQAVLSGPWRPLDEDRVRGRRVTFEMIYGRPAERVNFAPPSTRVDWMPDGRHYLQTREGKLYLVDALSGSASRFPDAAKIAASLAAIPTLDAARRRTISEQVTFQWNDERTAFLIAQGGDLYYVPIDGSPARRLTRARGEKQYAQVSPDGQFVAYVRNHNLYISDVATQTEQAVTEEKDANIRNGECSWVYFEEVFGRNWRAFWWSPDSRHVAFLRFDETEMPKFHALDTIPLHGALTTMSHPKPGDRNPAVTLGVASVAGGEVEWVDLSDYSPGEFLITKVGWREKNPLLYFCVQDRAQKWLDLRTCRAEETQTTLQFRETTKCWVDNPARVFFVKDEIIYPSERSGWQHLYAYNMETKKWRPITQGDWEIRSLDRVDEEAGWIYFTACERSPIATDWFRIRIDGTKQERLTERTGSHRIDLAPKGALAVDSWSSFQSAGDIRLINTDGQQIRTIDSRPGYVLEEFNLGKFEHVQIPTEDGFQLEATLTFPPNFDESKKYPVWLNTYAGPHAPVVRDSGGPSMNLRMQANLGLIMLQLDPRSASGKGAQSTWTAYKNLGVQELKDIECGINWLKKRPYVDGERIGMNGHSYGGFMTAYAMTHSTLFAAGISGSPVTDWRNYDSIYTERYMDTPQENPAGYNSTSVVKAAGKLHGKLLLLHGLMDENVHPQNSIQFMQALQRANKDFRVMFYPEQHHGLRGDHYNRLMHDFIKQTMKLDGASK
jgi:dipeptidyl aminopeptidase/acylaminoacyl peptidase